MSSSFYKVVNKDKAPITQNLMKQYNSLEIEWANFNFE